MNRVKAIVRAAAPSVIRGRWKSSVKATTTRGSPPTRRKLALGAGALAEADHFLQLFAATQRQLAGRRS